MVRINGHLAQFHCMNAQSFLLVTKTWVDVHPIMLNVPETLQLYNLP